MLIRNMSIYLFLNKYSKVLYIFMVCFLYSTFAFSMDFFKLGTGMSEYSELSDKSMSAEVSLKDKINENLSQEYGYRYIGESVHQLYYGYSLGFELEHNIYPYIKASISNNFKSYTNNSITPSFGLGIEYKINSNYIGYFDYIITTDALDESENLTYTLGVSYRFDTGENRIVAKNNAKHHVENKHNSVQLPQSNNLQPKSIKITLTGLFEFDKYKPIKIPMIKDIMKIRKINLYGHTDSIGSNEYNNKLSYKRASNIKTALVNMRVSDKLINVYYFGESKPIDTNSTPQGRQNNRRVEIEIYYD